MVNKKNIIYLVISLGCLIASYYIHRQTKHKIYVNSKFVAEEVQGSYSRRTTIKYDNLEKDGEKKLVEKCLQILDSLQAHKYDDYEGFGDNIRNQIIPIADSLGIEINPYQSNVSALNMILNSLVICKNRNNNDDLRLIVYQFERSEGDSMKLAIWPIHDHKNTEQVEFLESGRVLSKEEVYNFQGEMPNVEVKITEPRTSESKVIKYKGI